METETMKGYTEEAVVAKAQAGDRTAYDYLVAEYTPQINQLVKALFLKGGEREDLVQEGLIGLYEAVQAFKPKRKVKFRTFAMLCIKRQLYSAMESAGRDKHEPLNSYISLSDPLSAEHPEQTLESMLDGLMDKTPLDEIIDSESLMEYSQRFEETLTPLELAILIKYLEGSSYKEISRSTGRDLKSVDNAIQRIRKKLSPKR